MKFGSLFGVNPSAEATESRCPGCGSTIPLEDINVAKDLALCRTCGKTWSFSAARSAREIGALDLEQPPRGVRVRTEYDGTTTILYRRRSGALIFLIPFTLFWGGLSLGGIYGSQIKQGRF